jgi:hypothetical protein
MNEMPKVGDVVYLNSGSPPLNVTAIYPDNQAVYCMWTNDDWGVCGYQFPLACLTREKPDNA